ncbi:MAG TPA: HD domain-containing protein [Nitrososphaerales archaeon]|nr:HD domain-containing protein [Nitrososphaerales archaeon]
MPKTHARKGAEAFKESAEIRDPIHGYIYASEIERKIIDTETFQRLRRIRQLAGCHLVYPGGQHSRFEHVIGAMYLAGKVGEVLEMKRAPLTPDQAIELRLAALLHDIGHGPFSHVFEEVMAERTPFTHEDMTQKIVLRSEIGDVLGKNGFSKKALAELAVGKSKTSKLFLNDVIGGGLSVDIMDYLLRDSYFTGVEYGKVDVRRIVNSFEVYENRLAIGQAAMFAFEALMIARYEMFRAVYFHRTVRAAELMLIKSMILADKELHLTDLSLENYLSLTDEVTLFRIRTMNVGSDKELGKAKEIAFDYSRRNLLKCVFERSFLERDKFLNSIFNSGRIRAQLAEEIASGAGVDPESVFVDVPTAPSIPVSSTREALDSVSIVKSKENGSKDYHEMKISEMPLVGTITGFMDIIRVYTDGRHRSRVGRSVGRIFGREGFETKVSM